MIARSTGAAPRQRGSSDGCTLSTSKSLSSGSLISAPKAQTISDVGRGGGDPRAGVVGVDGLGLVELEAERAGGVGDGRRLELAAAPLRAVGPGDDELRAVLGLREALEDGGREGRGAEVDGAH